MEKIKTLFGFFFSFSPAVALFHDSFKVIYEAQRKHAKCAGVVKINKMHCASTRYQLTVSLSAMVIKNAALSP